MINRATNRWTPDSEHGRVDAAGWLEIRSTVLSQTPSREVIEMLMHDGRDFETSTEAIRIKVQTPLMSGANLIELNRAALRRAADHILAEIDRLDRSRSVKSRPRGA